MKLYGAILFTVSSFLLGTVSAAVKVKGGADPSIIKYGDDYYSVGTWGGGVSVWKASTFDTLDDGERKDVWKGKEGWKDVWAPEITVIDGKTWIFFAGKDDGVNHRMFAISADSPHGDYSSETKIPLPGNKSAIDGMWFKFEGQGYFIWSGVEPGSSDQNLRICKMKSPTEPDGDYATISQPRETWEMKEGLINEGPEAIVDPNGQLHIVYSANGSWSDKYCLADLRLKKGGDPLKIWDWFKSNGCLFGSHQENMMDGWDATLGVNGPGHHTFALKDGDIANSPGGTHKIPFVFHAVEKGTDYSWGARACYSGTYVWWAGTTYRRGDEDTGFSFKFFE